MGDGYTTIEVSVIDYSPLTPVIENPTLIIEIHLMQDDNFWM
jgi:hypothetical protein